MDNVRKRTDVTLINNAKDYIGYTCKPSFVSQKIFNKNFVSIHKIKTVLTLDMPIYIQLSILDLSKLLMYEFHYKYIEKKNFNANLLFIDTDSLVYENETDDVNEDFCKDKNLFDLSDYPQDTKFFDPANKKVIGKM